MIHDLRLSIRQLFAAPGFCFAVILTLTLGIGVNTAVFGLLDGFLLRQLPYPQPERIGGLVVHTEGVSERTGKTGSDDDNSFTGESWNILRQNISSLDFASYGGSSGANLKSDTYGAVRYVQAARVSANYFQVLGIPLYRGRSFSPDEDRPNGPPVAVLSNDLWRGTFRSDEHIVGKAIHLKGEPYAVIGVLPPNAVTPLKGDLFTALKPATTGECGGNNCGILVRLKPDASWHQVNAELAHLRLPWFADFVTRHHGRVWLYARPLQVDLASGVGDKVSILMLTVLFVLLIACANLAGLTLVRISRREPEIATRLALGASRWQVVRQLWTENLVLALLGGAAAIGCATLIVEFFNRTLPEGMIPIGGLSLDSHVLAFAFGTALLTSLLFGALPALQTRGVDLRSSIARWKSHLGQRFKPVSSTPDRWRSGAYGRAAGRGRTDGKNSPAPGNPGSRIRSSQRHCSKGVSG